MTTTCKKFVDNDGATYSINDIINLNKSDVLFTPEEIIKLSEMKIGEVISPNMGEWIERIR
jgi:hypothetical protein